MFAAFLSQDMTYSCAIFPDLDGDILINGAGLFHPISNVPRTNGKLINSQGILSPPPGKQGVDELCDAQIRKLKHIIKKADVKPGHRVLEIGTGKVSRLSPKHLSNISSFGY
jgi:cyclopropane-fatty-acyl-phospholipid synthase